MFIDRPRPSVEIFLIVMAIWAFVGLGGLLLLRLTGSLLIFVGGLSIAFVSLEIIHGALTTEYRIEGGFLHVRSGWLMNDRIAVRDIVSVDPIKRMTRISGGGSGSMGCCNRLRNGLRLRTSGDTWYVSPDVTKGFCEALLTCNNQITMRSND